MLKQVIYAFIATGLFYLVLCFTHNDPQDSKAELAPQYLPSDIGEKTVLWLEPNADGVLTLQWEKHVDAGYGMAQRTTSTGRIAVPVNVD